MRLKAETVWVKAAIIAAVLAMVGGAVAGAVLAYNKAIERAERLESVNQILQESAKLAQAERAKAEKILLERETIVEVIHETEIKTVEVIRTVQGECLDVRMPADLIARLRHGTSDRLQDRENLPPSIIIEGLPRTRL
jgi:hypothetical protein